MGVLWHRLIWKLALISMLFLLIPMVIDLVNMVVTGPRIDYNIRFAANRGIQYTTQETFRGGGMSANLASARSHTNLALDGLDDWRDIFGTNDPATVIGLEIFDRGTAPTQFTEGLGTTHYEEVRAAERWAGIFGNGASEAHRSQMANFRSDIDRYLGNNPLGDDIQRWLLGPGGDDFFGYQMLTPNNLGIAFVPVEVAERAARWHLATLLTAGNLDRLFTRNGEVFTIWYGWEVNLTSFNLIEAETRMINTETLEGRTEFLNLVGGSGPTVMSNLQSHGSGWTRILFFDYTIQMRYVGIAGFRIFARTLREMDTDFIMTSEEVNPTVLRWLDQSQEAAETMTFRHSDQTGNVGRGMDGDILDSDWHWDREDGTGGNGINRTWFGLSRVGSGRLMYYHVH